MLGGPFVGDHSSHNRGSIIGFPYNPPNDTTTNLIHPIPKLLGVSVIFCLLHPFKQLLSSIDLVL